MSHLNEWAFNTAEPSPINTLTITLYSDSESDNENDDDDSKLEEPPSDETENTNNHNSQSNENNKQNANRKRKRNDINNSDNDGDILNQPKRKKQKVNNAFETIIKKKQIKKKKKIHQSKNKIVENKFMNLKEKHRKLLNADIDNEDWLTVAEMAGFDETEIPILSRFMHAYVRDTRDATVEDVKLIYNPIPPDFLPRTLKREWNRGSLTFKMVSKRVDILYLYRSTDFNIKSKSYSSIIQMKMKSKNTLLSIKDALNKRSFKNKESKLFSINDIIEAIKKSENKQRDLRKICDNLISIKKELKNKINQLNKIKHDIINQLQFQLKLITIKDDKIINLQYRTINGRYKYKAPKLFSSYQTILDNAQDIQNEINNKLQLLENVKLKNVKSRARQAHAARERDKKRKQKKKEQEEKEVQTENESDDNDFGMTEYTY